jgi:hypothetical protein
VRGFATGDAVTVDGEVIRGDGASGRVANGARMLHAQRLVGSDVAAYRAARAAGASVLPLIGALFTALGLAGLTLGGMLLWRARRTRPAPQGGTA